MHKSQPTDAAQPHWETMMTGKPAQPGRYTCNEYREEMILLGLQKRLSSPDLSDKERQALLKEIAKVEKQMGL